MSGNAEARADVSKAIYYYKAGVRLRCQTCTHSLASWYEEGIEGILPSSTRMAENLFRRALLLCDDANDGTAAIRVLKDLTALHITAIKMADPGTKEATYHAERLERVMSDDEFIQNSLADVEKAILQEMNNVKKMMLADLLGPTNAARIAGRATILMEAERQRIAIADDDAAVGVANGSDVALEHVFGSVSEQARKPRGSRLARNRS